MYLFTHHRSVLCPQIFDSTMRCISKFVWRTPCVSSLVIARDSPDRSFRDKQKRQEGRTAQKGDRVLYPLQERTYSSPGARTSAFKHDLLDPESMTTWRIRLCRFIWKYLFLFLKHEIIKKFSVNVYRNLWSEIVTWKNKSLFSYGFSVS